MKKFELVGLKSPGTINLPELGTIDLEKVDDAQAEKLWRSGLPYLKPTPEYRRVLFPAEKPLDEVVEMPKTKPSGAKKK